MMNYEVTIEIPVYNVEKYIRLTLKRNSLRVAPVGYGEDYTFTVDLPTYVNRVVLLPDITYSYIISPKNNYNHIYNLYYEKI